MNKTKTVYDWLKTAGMKFGDKSKLLLALNLVKEEVEELSNAIMEDDLEEIKDAVIDLHYVTRNASYFAGISPEDLEEMWNKVTASNFSKFCTTEEEAIKTVEDYKKKGITTSYVKNGEYFVILRDDGKILKSINYKAVKDL